MGNFFSVVKGGQHAVGGGGGGGAHHGAQGAGGGGTTTHNDAVDLFFRNKGMNSLYTQIDEVDETKPGEKANLGHNKRKRGKKLVPESGGSCDTSSSSDSEEMIIEESVSDLAAAQNSGRSSRQKHQVSYIESEGEDDGLENPAKRSREGKSSDEKGQQEGMVDAGPHCDNPFKQKESNPSKGNSPEGNNKLGKNQTTEQAAGAPENGVKRVEIIDESESDISSLDEQVPVVFDCPDPEFNDFNKDREEGCFAVDEFWACYGNADGMPRFYAQIRKVYTAGFKLRITWLEPDPDDEDEIDWVDKELPVGCGKYRRGGSQDTTDRLTFSHQVACEKGSKKGSFLVYPRKGETWALFKDWDIKCTEPENHESYKFEIVEVFTNFAEGVGIRVALSDKVRGSVSLFHHSSESRTGEFVIPPNELFRFSHRVPSFKMTGTEKGGVPEGSFELDPASLPANPDDICYPSMFMLEMDDKNLGPQGNSVCQESSARECKLKMSENLSTPKKSDQCNGKRDSDGEDSVLRRSPRGLNTANKEQVNASHVPSQRVTANNLNSREGRSCEAEVARQKFCPVKLKNLINKYMNQVQGAEEFDQQIRESSLRRSGSISSSLSPSRNVPQDLFYDFKSDRSSGKFEEGQIWALYKPEDKIPKVYGQIKKVGFAPLMLHVALFEACSVPKKGIKPVCGSFKAKNGRPRPFESSCFSHLLDAKLINKNRFEVYPMEGQIWALYKNWNSEFSSSDMENCEYDIVEIIGKSNGRIKVSSLVPLKGYKSVFRSSGKSISNIGPMDMAEDDLARFSHQIPAFQLTTEKGGSLAGCWELDPAAVPCNVLPAK